MERQEEDTFGSLDCYLSGGLLEAPTLSSKEIKHARVCMLQSYGVPASPFVRAALHAFFFRTSFCAISALFEFWKLELT